MTILILLALASFALLVESQDIAQDIGNVFSCRNGTYISPDWRCNGIADCADGIDEEDCFMNDCGDGRFLCADRRQCVPQEKMCNGYLDCVDGSDEAGCSQEICSGFFCINDGSCIPKTSVCDGERDCENGTDEEMCVQNVCPPRQFQCKRNQTCIPKLWKCDGDIDCVDGSDEQDCRGRNRCDQHTFHCVKDETCIPETWLCDGKKNCADGSDETNCTIETCEQFRCRNGRCVDNMRRCNKADDCGDGSDEDDCGIVCSEDQTLCTEDYRCIPITWKCDGANDCSNGSDEAACEALKCEGLLCPDSRCVREEVRCDGRWDCSDGSDESGCEEFACGKMNCSQGCGLTPNGTACYCRPGFVLLSDMRSCSSVIESTPNVTSSSGPLLLYATSNRGIHGIWLKPNSSFTVHYSTSPVVAIDMDVTRRVLVWSELSDNGSSVYERFLNGTNTTLVLSLPLSAIEGLAVDKVTSNVYFTDRGLKRILVCKLDGWLCSNLITTGISNPGAIALHPEEKEMFWIEREGRPSIMRAHMDGTDVTPLVNTSLSRPSSLAYDEATNRVYWADAEKSTIESLDLTTGKRRTVVRNRDFHPDIIAIFHDELYWSDWRNLSINGGDKFNGSGWDKLIAHMDTSITGIVVHETGEVTHNITNPCEASPCSDICVQSGGGYKCLCRFGYELNADDSSCKLSSTPVANVSHATASILVNETQPRENDISSGFVIVAEGSTIYRVDIGKVEGDHVKKLGVEAPVFVGALAFDWKGQTLYFDDTAKNSLLSLHVGSADVKVVHLEHNGSISGMDFDGSNRNLYWVDESKKTLEVCRANGSAHAVLLRDLEKPIDVEVYPEEGVLFVLSLTEFPSITRYNMDGTKPERLWSLSSVRSMSFSIDETAGLLFWADPLRNGIGWVSVRNQSYSPMMLVEPVQGVAVSLSAGKDRVFWVTSTDSALFYLDVFEGRIKSVALPYRNSTVPRKVVYATPAPRDGRGVCSVPENGGCSHICLPSGLRSSCLCPSGMAHGTDSHLCKETQDQ